MGNNLKTKTIITKEHLDNAMSYQQYTDLIEKLLEEGKTTGPQQSEDLFDYAKLNKQRMDRLDKTAVLTKEVKDALDKIKEPTTWLVLTEGWCGDAAQNIPVIQKMAEANPNIQLKFLLRDENPTIMDQYLTDGGRSIPKLIWLNENLEEIATWGPRPENVQKLVRDYKANPTVPFKEFAVEIHTWYAKDKTQSFQKEFTNLIEDIV